jgi:hypothetical protein
MVIGPEPVRDLGIVKGIVLVRGLGSEKWVETVIGLGTS